VLQQTWTQSAPCNGDPATCIAPGTPIPAGESLVNCNPTFDTDLGPRGYRFTISAIGDVHDGNDFGNFTNVECKQDPNAHRS
jgi:hypothetical protein